MINLKTSGKKIASLTLIVLVMSACSTEIGPNTEIGNKTSQNSNNQVITANSTYGDPNIEKMKADYINYLKEQELSLQEPASYNVLTKADFQVGSFATKANLTVVNPGIKGVAIIVTVGTASYTLSYEFMRKLRISLNAAATDNLLTLADYTRLLGSGVTGTITDGADSSSYKPSVSEAAFVAVLKTMDAVTMPNFLQGFDAAEVETNADGAGVIAISADQEGSHYTLSKPELAFISNAKSVAIRSSFYEAVWDATAGDTLITPFTLDARETAAIKAADFDFNPSTAATPFSSTAPLNASELAYLNGINAQLTAFSMTLMDGGLVQDPVDTQVGFGNLDYPGASTGTVPIYASQNLGMVNRNVAAISNDGGNLSVQLDAGGTPLTLLKHPAGTNYAAPTAIVAAKLLLQGASSSGAGYNTKTTTQALGNLWGSAPYDFSSPVTTANAPDTFMDFHSVIRNIHEQNIVNPPTGTPTTAQLSTYATLARAGLTFTFTGTAAVPVLTLTSGLGKALTDAPVALHPWALTKGAVASTQNKTAIEGWLDAPKNLNKTFGSVATTVNDASVNAGDTTVTLMSAANVVIGTELTFAGGTNITSLAADITASDTSIMVSSAVAANISVGDVLDITDGVTSTTVTVSATWDGTSTTIPINEILTGMTTIDFANSTVTNTSYDNSDQTREVTAISSTTVTVGALDHKVPNGVAVTGSAVSTGLGHNRAVVVPCTRSAAGALTFTGTANHYILVKYEIANNPALPNGGKIFFVYDPGMPNNPNQPGSVMNYRPMTDAERTGLFASPNKLVGISTY